MDNGENGEWRIYFVTKLPFEVPRSSIVVPSNSSRLHLSTLLNTLLNADDPNRNPEPFDFCINGELLRMPLAQFCLAKGIPQDSTLEIEFIRAVVPRKKEDPIIHDDWVSAVDGSNSRHILTGCYDALGRVWKEGKHCTHVLEGHHNFIHSITIINPKDDTENINVVTASKDRDLRLWKLNIEESINPPIKIRASKILRGHLDSVNSVAAMPSGDMVCSGSWDRSIKLWPTNSEGAVVPKIKKRKGPAAVVEILTQVDAVSTLTGHTDNICSVVWPRQSTVYSGSADCSIRGWDVETGKDSSKIMCRNSLRCIDIGGESCGLIAAGFFHPFLRIWDARNPGASPVFQSESHTKDISACKWHPTSHFHLLTASFDGVVMLWDIRSAVPLAVGNKHEEKALCVDWWRGDSVISGGSDNKLLISSGCGIPV